MLKKKNLGLQGKGMRWEKAGGEQLRSEKNDWLRSWLNSKPSYRSGGVPEETLLFQEKTEESPSGPENQIQDAENMRQRSRPMI